MGLIVGILLIIALISVVVAIAVHSRLREVGRSRWGWTIASFFITAIVLIIAGYALVLYMFGFER